MTTKFKHIMLMVKDILAAVKFYSEGYGTILSLLQPAAVEATS